MKIYHDFNVSATSPKALYYPKTWSTNGVNQYCAVHWFSKESPVLGNSNWSKIKEPAGSTYFKTLKELMVFMKELNSSFLVFTLSFLLTLVIENTFQIT